MAPGVLIVGSLPESDAEAGGQRGSQALRRTGEGLWPGSVAVAARIRERDL